MSEFHPWLTYAGCIFGVGWLLYVLLFQKPLYLLHQERKLKQTCDLLKEVFDKAHVPQSHGILHALKVLRHAHRALEECPGLSLDIKLAVMLAAFLHDADDRKYFPKSKNYDNARKIIREIYPEAEDIVIQMIGYVSASVNGNTIPKEAIRNPWMLYPRWADRLEAIGHIGIVRAWEYTLETNRPLFTRTTQRAKDIHELSYIANADRYKNYVASGGKSKSMIDHYYDKLLHISNFETDNKYLLDMAKERHKPLVEICLLFGEDGRLDIDLLDRARRRSKNE